MSPSLCFSCTPSSSKGGFIYNPAYTNTVTLDSAGNVYTINNSNKLCVADPGTAACKQLISGFLISTGTNAVLLPSIDGNGTYWAPNYNSNNIVGYSYSTQPGSIKYTCTGGGMNYPVATAVDGSNNICVVNAGAVLNSGTYNSLSEFNSTCTASSPTTVYAPLNGALSLNSGSLAIDRAGDIWVVYSGSDYLYEVIGIATPTVSPTAFATFNNLVGTPPL